MTTTARANFDPDERLVSPAELARFLSVPVATIYQYRHRGDGPPGFN